MSVMLELDAISAGYGETEILHGVDLHVDQGEIVVIIGPNGAGKTTAMKAVFGGSARARRKGAPALLPLNTESDCPCAAGTPLRIWGLYPVVRFDI